MSPKRAQHRLAWTGKMVLALLTTSALLVALALGATRHLLMRLMDETGQRDEVVDRTQKMALLVSKAADAAASYALTRSDIERSRVFDRLAEARAEGRLLLPTAVDANERASLTRALSDIDANERTAHAVLDRAEVDMTAYHAFDDDLDRTEADLEGLEAAFRARAAAIDRDTERRASLSVYAVGLVTLAVAVVVGLAIARRLTRPLASLRASALAFDADARDIDVPYDADDELGDLARAFRSMADRLRADRVDIANARAELVDVFASVDQAIFVVDENERITKANPTALALVGRGPLEGVPIEEVLRDVHGDALVDGDTVLSARDAEIPVRVTVSQLRKGRGRVVCAYDRRAQLELEADRRAAERLEEIGRLAAGIAHEIRSPLQYVGDNLTYLTDAHAAMIGALERDHSSAADGDVAFALAEAPSALASAREGLERVSAIIQAMTEFAHPSRAALAETDINRVVTSTLAIARHEYKYVADVTTKLATLPPIPCLPGQLGQALLNLVVNAAHAIADTGTRGRITVETRLRAEDVVVSVSDTGMGIPEAVRAKVFEPFFTTKGRGRGTGQGLALVKRVVDAHHGRVTLDSEVGRGTKFELFIPRRAAEPAVANGSVHH